MRRRLVVLVVASLLALGSACSKDSDSKDGVAVDDTTTTAAPLDSTTTTAGVPEGPATTPEAAANGLFDAYKRGDRDDASRYARQRAINALFAHPWTGDTKFASQGCTPEGGQFLCSWTYEGGAMQMTVEGVLGSSGYVVDNVTYTAD